MGLAKKFQPSPRTGIEVFRMLPEGTLAELLNDSLHLSPAPTYHHQKLIFELLLIIGAHVKKHKLGDCVQSPVDVFLDEQNIVQPDILIFTSERLTILTDEGQIKGAPDFIIEVLSPVNKKHDTEKKKTLYEKFGVKEYFIIDPDNEEVVTYYAINNKFVKQETVKEN